MGDGGFWHNGLTSGVGNAVFNQTDNVLVIVDNGYSAATGGQDILSSRADNRSKSTKHPIAEAVKGVGVKWLRVVDRTYDLTRMRDTLREAMTTTEKGPKVIVAASECMLNRQRRERPLQQPRDRGRAAAWCASGSAWMPIPAPATTPASACRAARRSPFARILIRCGRIRSRTSTIPASAAGCAARWRTRRCCVPLSIARNSCSIPPAGIDSRPRCAARSSAFCNGWRKPGGRAMHSDRRAGRSRSPSPLSAARAGECSPIGSSRSRSVMAGWCSRLPCPGVAQRTGTTVYYLEICPPPAPGTEPVFALMPVPGDVDVVVAAELMEAGRAVVRGLVTPAANHARRLDASGLWHHREIRRSATASRTRRRCSRRCKASRADWSVFDMEAICRRVAQRHQLGAVRSACGLGRAAFPTRGVRGDDSRTAA